MRLPRSESLSDSVRPVLAPTSSSSPAARTSRTASAASPTAGAVSASPPTWLDQARHGFVLMVPRESLLASLCSIKRRHQCPWRGRRSLEELSSIDVQPSKATAPPGVGRSAEAMLAGLLVVSSEQGLGTACSSFRNRGQEVCSGRGASAYRVGTSKLPVDESVIVASFEVALPTANSQSRPRFVESHE